MLKRIDYEMTQIKEKKQRMVDKAASEGATIDLSTLRKNWNKPKLNIKVLTATNTSAK